MKKGILVTADGSVFTGIASGADGIATGEIVFNTAMTGYQEILTDPSYAGQVVVLTAPHIGNYGSAAFDDQADTIYAQALIMDAAANPFGAIVSNAAEATIGAR